MASRPESAKGPLNNLNGRVDRLDFASGKIPGMEFFQVPNIMLARRRGGENHEKPDTSSG